MKKRITALLAALALTALGVTQLASCSERRQDGGDEGLSSADESAARQSPEENIEASYYYCHGTKPAGDPALKVLTDGDPKTSARLTNGAYSSGNAAELKLSRTDWYGNARETAIASDDAALVLDAGFTARIKRVECVFPNGFDGRIKIFASTDGYNFTYYLGEGECRGSDFSFEADFSAKALMLRFSLEYGKELVISEVRLLGKAKEKKKLLSRGAECKYEQGGSAGAAGGAESAIKLTDGETFEAAGENALFSELLKSETDPTCGKRGGTATLDLGEVKNISEIEFPLFVQTGSLPELIQTQISDDGGEFRNFGQSRKLFSTGEGKDKAYVYRVTKPFTEKARYVRIRFYTSAAVTTDEISVYGSEEPVAKPDYAAPCEGISYTNVAGSPGAKNYCGAAVYCEKEPRGAEIFAVSGGKKTRIESEAAVSETAGKYVARFYFEPTEADSIEIVTGNDCGIIETQFYAARAQLPAVKGGFFQLPTNGSGGGAGDSDEYAWYLQLKGMADLGMKYFVLQYSTHFGARSSIFSGKALEAAGYKHAAAYGVCDVPEAILCAADELGMKVWLGTVHDADFTAPLENRGQYSAICEDAKAVIADIKEKYSGHASFAGYYLSDETCDQWLAGEGGVQACRFVYESQSEYIREIDPDAKIMIAPAIWRAGTAAQGAENIYKMIAPREEGGRPVVDIVAAQDCLGRERTLVVEDRVYDSYYGYAKAWAEAVRAAGAEFWHDAEVFEITGLTKRAGEVRDSLNVEALISGNTIVFDIPHYFTLYPLAECGDDKQYYLLRNMLEYVEYYSALRGYDAVSGEAPAIEFENRFSEAELPQHGQAPGGDSPAVTPGDGAITFGTPGSESFDLLEFKKFTLANGSGKAPEYAFAFDGSSFYIILKSNDETESFGKGEWWEGKDDLVQIWINGKGETGGDALASPDGIRFYVHSTAAGKFKTGGEYGSAAATRAGKAEVLREGSVYIIKLPWSLLGADAPAPGSGARIAVNIQYIDGADGSWAASNGNKGRSLTEKEIYTF